MKKDYKRVTDIGFNTGKLIIGCHYLPPPPPAGAHASFICGVLRGTERISFWNTITSQIRAKVRLVKERLNAKNQ